jgi:hypothetical protein
MRKTILLLPLVLLPAFGQNKAPKGGADNDSPIVVSDSTNPLPTTKGPQTTAVREHPRGNQHFKTVNNGAAVHDKENPGAGAGEKDSYRPACLVFSSSTDPIKIPATAKTWSVVYLEGSNEVPLMSWAASSGDIALEGFNVSGTSATAAITIKNKDMKVRIGDNDQNPTMVNAGASDPLLKVHYCPGGKCTYCKNPDAKGNCPSGDDPVDPCAK